MYRTNTNKWSSSTNSQVRRSPTAAALQDSQWRQNVCGCKSVPRVKLMSYYALTSPGCLVQPKLHSQFYSTIHGELILICSSCPTTDRSLFFWWSESLEDLSNPLKFHKESCYDQMTCHSLVLVDGKVLSAHICSNSMQIHGFLKRSISFLTTW